MNTNSLKVVTNIWSKIAKNATTKELEKIEIEIYKKMLNFFQVGDFAYMILNLSTAKLEYISEEIEKLNNRPTIPKTIPAIGRPLDGPA